MVMGSAQWHTDQRFNPRNTLALQGVHCSVWYLLHLFHNFQIVLRERKEFRFSWKNTSPKYVLHNVHNVDEIHQGCQYRSDFLNKCDDDDSEDSDDDGDDQDEYDDGNDDSEDSDDDGDDHDEYEGQAVNGAIRAVGALKFPLRVWTRPRFSTHIRHFLRRQNPLQHDGDDKDDHNHNRKRRTKENQQ